MRQVAQLRLFRGEAQRPAGLAAHALRAAGPEPRVAHRDPAAGGRGELVGRELVHERPSLGAVEDGAPHRPPRRLRRRLVDGVADPHPERAVGGDRAQVEGLVHPRARRRVGKHGVDVGGLAHADAPREGRRARWCAVWIRVGRMDCKYPRMERDSLVKLPAALARFDVEPTPRDASFLLGIDGGATKTLAAVLDLEHGRLHLGHGGPSNQDAVGVRAAGEALFDAADEALAGAGIGDEQLDGAVLAVAGTDTDAVVAHVRAERSQEWIVVGDVVGAWATATGARPGVGAISGTGSNVFGVSARRSRVARRRLGPPARRRGLGLLVGRAVDQGGAARPRALRPADRAERRRRWSTSVSRASRRWRRSSTASRSPRARSRRSRSRRPARRSRRRRRARAVRARRARARRADRRRDPPDRPRRASSRWG